MPIRSLHVRGNGKSTLLTRHDRSIIDTVISRKSSWRDFVSPRDALAIIFEQTFLAKYVQSMNDQNKNLLTYLQKCQQAAESLTTDSWLTSGNPQSKRMTEPTISAILDYCTGKSEFIPLNIQKNIYNELSMSTYFTMPEKFFHSYLNCNVTPTLTDDITNPVVLLPTIQKDKLSPAMDIVFFGKSYTSARTIDRPQYGKTLRYILSMNYNGKDWKDFIENVLAFGLPGSTPGAESLSNKMRSFIIERRCTPVVLNRKSFSISKNTLLDCLDLLIDKNTLSTIWSETERQLLYNLLKDFGVTNHEFLTTKVLTVSQEKLWNNFNHLHGIAWSEEPRKPKYAMENSKDDSDVDSESDDDSDNDSDSSDDDDLFSKDDLELFDDEDKDSASEDSDDDEGDDDSSDESDSDDSDDDDGSSSGSSSSDSTDTQSSSGDSDSDSDSDDDSSDSESEEDDTNPLITIIEDETFDDYLDRNILEVRINRIIRNPPDELSIADVNFLKYWYLVWFPCVSVNTTRDMLRSLIGISR